jgi:hypothetical protein
MNDDLIARAKEYLTKTEGITRGWVVFLEDNGVVTIEGRDSEDYFLRLNEGDETAINLTPAARNLIEELVKRLEDYEERVTEVNEAMGLFENTRQGLEIAYGIMTQNKEVKENDHNA